MSVTLDDLRLLLEVSTTGSFSQAAARLGWSQPQVSQRIAALEGAEQAVATATGMAAILAVVMSLCSAGDHVLVSRSVFGSTISLVEKYFKRFGIEVDYVPLADLSGWDAAIKANTKLLFVESPSNPLAELVDIAELAKIAHAKGAMLVVDNCFCTPALQQPLKLGADVVVHSATKFIGGHGTAIGGVIVDGGTFDWEKSGKFPDFTEPDESYHGVVYTDTFGPAAFIARARTVPLRNTGSALSPMNAFLLLQGLETLALRMERHVENALKVAHYLQDHPQVAWVSYAGLPDHPHHALAQKYMGGKPSAILSFGLKAGYEAGVRFYDALQIFKRLVNIGDAKSLACHPASTTHRQMTETEQAKAGVKPEMIRLSVGIEAIEDLLPIWNRL